MIAAAIACATAACSHPPDAGDGAAAAPSAPSIAPPAGSAVGATTAAAAGPTPSPATTAPAEAGHLAGSDMVTVPAGIFLMGSRMGEGGAEERPMHEVVMPSFDLDRTEVTMDAYEACVKAGACRPTHVEHPFCNAKLGGRGDHPVNCVEWGDAEAYCKFAGKRLPTEREWEYAASGGAERRKFSWGDEEPDGARSCYTHPGTCPVASFAPGAFGLYDVSGNVWEWTSSWFTPYPEEGAAGQHKVYRGGSWSRRFPKWLRNRLRNRYKPTEWSASLGVRCARSRSPLACPDEAEARGDACVRVKGTPQCEPGYGWNGKACSLGGAGTTLASAPGPGGGYRPALGPEEAARRAGGSTRPPGWEPQPSGAAALDPATGKPVITRSRTPQYDGDCKAHWPKTPAAYRFQGGDFWARNPPIAAAGCTKRDMGDSWTSACCAE